MGIGKRERKQWLASEGNASEVPGSAGVPRNGQRPGVPLAFPAALGRRMSGGR